VASNFVCGNFSGGDGAGIGHLGLSDGGRITRNIIAFNESFNQGNNAHGAGIFVGGAVALAGQTLSPGAGNVLIEGNLIQGNLAGAGDGGGVRLARVNGQDVLGPVGEPYRVDLFDDFIVNNIAGLAGGGISLQDVVSARIIHCTISHNDSLATVGEAFIDPNTSVLQPGAGIVSRAHSPELVAASGQRFSNPQLVNDIIWRNRSFHYGATGDDPPFGLVPRLQYDANYQVIGGVTAGLYNDLAVLGSPVATDRLDPRWSILTDASGYDASNVSTDPAFAARYFNGPRGLTTVGFDATTGIDTPPAFDEGGNFIRPRFGPLTLYRPGTAQPYGNYHVTTGIIGQ
jgi:hypothetical protein